MSLLNPTQSISFQEKETVALSQPLFISGDGFFLYTPGYNSNNWTQYNITPSVKLNAVDYNDVNVALFAGNNGVVVKFDKNDLSITATVLDPLINFNNVSFYSNSSKAIVIGDSGSVYKSTDAGSSWSKVTLPTNVSASLRGVTFSSSYWYICGDKGTILSSSNEGSSWYQYSEFYRYDASNFVPITADYHTYDFNDIQYNLYENNGTYDKTYDMMIVVGSSGSVFANNKYNPLPIKENTWYDMSAYNSSQVNGNSQPLISSQTSSIYNKILYINEWYFKDSGLVDAAPNRPTNFGVVGNAGELYICNCLSEGSTPSTSPPSDFYSTENYVYTASLKDFSNNPINPTGGGLYSLIYSNVVSSAQNNIFYQRLFLITTDDGTLWQYSYPADNDGGNISFSTIISPQKSESFSGALTDIDLPDGSNIFNNSTVRFGLDKPFPQTSNFMMYGKRSAGSDYLTQGMRLYRPFKSENFVTFTDSFPDGTGFIIPEGYDKDLNYLEIAKKAGLI